MTTWETIFVICAGGGWLLSILLSVYLFRGTATTWWEYLILWLCALIPPLMIILLVLGMIQVFTKVGKIK